MVARAAGDRNSPGWLRHLLDLGGISGSALRLGSLPFSLLFAVDPGELVASFASDFDPLDAPGLSGHLLLLPKGLLPLVFPTAPGLRGDRAPTWAVYRRARLPVHSAKCTSLLSV